MRVSRRRSRVSVGLVGFFRNLSLLWKLLLPFLVLMLIAGVVGGFLVVRTLASRAETALEQDLARISLDSDALVRDRELYLLESVNLAANLRGMASALQRRDRDQVGRLLRSVVAIKTDLTALVAIDRRGRELRTFSGTSSVPPGAISSWGHQPFVQEALADAGGGKTSGFVRLGDEVVLAIASGVCGSARACSSRGAVIAAVKLDEVVTQAARGEKAEPTRGVGMFTQGGKLLAASGRIAPGAPPVGASRGPVRRISDETRDGLATLYAPLEIGGRAAGILAVSIPVSPAFVSARDAGISLGLILVAATVGALLIGAGLSSLILRQVRPLIATNRALGSGDLDARAPVLSEDELGELARGVNDMADQLQASHETLEARVADRTAEVERLLQERTEFFAGLSHQLQTPLAVILTKADLMIDRGFRKTQAWSAQTGETLRSSAAQLLDLVNNILRFAKAQAGGLELDMTPTDLREVVEELRGSIEGLALQGGLRSSIAVPEGLPAVMADRGSLIEIIQNLMDNAIKYTPPGGEVRLTASARNGAVEVHVKDNGVGIPKAEGKRIFEPFYRVKRSRPQRGEPSSGLGLAMAKRLVEAHGGEISFASRKKGSTTFVFTIPVAAGSTGSG